MKDYVDARVQSVENELSTRIRSVEAELDRRVTASRDEFHRYEQFAKESINKAETSVDHRLAAMNEFRDQLTDQATRFETKDDAEKDRTALALRIEAIEKWQANVAGRSVGLALIGGVLVATITAVFTHLLT